jgi:hypothetical protein
MFRVVRIEDQFEICCDHIYADARVIRMYCRDDYGYYPVFAMARTPIRVVTLPDSCSPSEQFYQGVNSTV